MKIDVLAPRYRGTFMKGNYILMENKEKETLKCFEANKRFFLQFYVMWFQMKDKCEKHEIINAFKIKQVENGYKKFELTYNDDGNCIIVKNKSLEKILLNSLRYSLYEMPNDIVQFALASDCTNYLLIDTLSKDEMIECCWQNRAFLYKIKEFLDYEFIRKLLANKDYDATIIPTHIITAMTNDEILDLVELRPEIITLLNGRIESQEFLFELLKIVVTKKYPYKLGYFGNNVVQQVPLHLANKLYWQSLCMCDGYNYRLAPKEYISEKLVRYTIENAVDDYGISLMFEVLDEKYKTEEISRLAILRSPSCISYMMEEKITDDFLHSLMDAKCYNFMNYLKNKNVVSVDVMIRWLDESDNKYFFPSDYKNLKEKEIYMRAVKLDKMYNKFPDECFKSEEFNILYAERFGYDRRMEWCMTTDLWISAMKGNPRITVKYLPQDFEKNKLYESMIRDFVDIKHIPDEYINDNVFIAYAEANRITPDDLLEKNCKNMDVWCRVIRNLKAPCLRIPDYDIQTEEFCATFLHSFDKKGYNHYAYLGLLKYIPKEFEKIVVAESAKSLQYIKNPSKELCDYAIQCHPEARLYIKNIAPTERKETEDIVVTSFEQISLFDMFNIVA